MQMKDRLPGFGSGVDDGAEAVPGDAFLPRDLRRKAQQMTEQGVMLTRGVIERREVLARNQQHVRGSLRVEIAERDGVIVFVDFLRWNLTCDDFAKETVHPGLLS